METIILVVLTVLTVFGVIGIGALVVLHKTVKLLNQIVTEVINKRY